jgi:hypothetical protein
MMGPIMAGLDGSVDEEYTVPLSTRSGHFESH